MRKILVLLLGVTLLMAQTGQVLAQCAPNINGKLREIGVDASRVDNISITRDGTQEGHLQGYIAWIKLNDCRGSVVMNLTTYCLISTVYTRGSCRIDGVAAY